MSKQQTKVYLSKTQGLYSMYYVRNGMVRFRAGVKNSHWIDSIFSEAELVQRVAEGGLTGPIIVNNFQEKES